MNELFALFGAAFLLGLLSAGHCLGMCGGLLSAMAMRSSGRPMDIVLYNAGRIVSYGLAGLLAATVGWLIPEQMTFLLRILAALMLIAMALYISNLWRGLVVLERFGNTFWRYLQPIFSRGLAKASGGRLTVFGTGMLWGWLPCGLVYSTLAWSATYHDPLIGVLIMMAFGVGTLPTLLVSGFAAERLLVLLRRKVWRFAVAGFVAGFGIWTLWGVVGMSHDGHHGHHGAAQVHHHHH